MALAVTGGQGNVQATVQNTDALSGTVAHGEITLVTTPATADAMFRVFLSGVVIVGDEAGGSSRSAELHFVIPGKGVSDGGALNLSDGGLSAGTGSTEDGVFYPLSSEIYVGPSTAVKAVYTLRNVAAEQGEFTYNISYHYSASVIT